MKTCVFHEDGILLSFHLPGVRVIIKEIWGIDGEYTHSSHIYFACDNKKHIETKPGTDTWQPLKLRQLRFEVAHGGLVITSTAALKQSEDLVNELKQK